MSLETDRAPAERKAGEPANPCVMVIFGAAGDLTKRKLIPALYNLAKEGLLSPDFAVIGVARREMGTEEFREKIGQVLKKYATDGLDPKLWEQIGHLHYVCGTSMTTRYTGNFRRGSGRSSGAGTAATTSTIWPGP